MKQYTTPEQTAKLIELGFEKPKNEVKAEQAGDYMWCNSAYSIGELFEMLPDYVSIWDTHHPDTMERQWFVSHLWSQNNIVKSELIDAMFDMIIKLKEEGVI